MFSPNCGKGTNVSEFKASIRMTPSFLEIRKCFGIKRNPRCYLCPTNKPVVAGHLNCSSREGLNLNHMSLLCIVRRFKERRHPESDTQENQEIREWSRNGHPSLLFSLGPIINHPTMLLENLKCCLKSTTIHRQDSIRSYLVCTVGVVCNIISYGIVNGFGVIYPALLHEFEQGEAKTAWLGSMCMGIASVCGPIGGFLNLKLGPRWTGITGALVCTVALLISSQMSVFIVLFLTYGILFAFGCSLIYISVFNIVPKYFLRRRSLAAGLISTGPGAGVFVMSQVLDLSLSAFGWRGALMLVGGLMASLIIPILVFFVDNVENPKPVSGRCGGVWVTHIEDKPQPVWRNKPLIIYATTGSLSLLGIMIPQVHMVRYCEDLGINLAMASRLYIGFGIGSMISRVLTGIFADHPSVNPLYIHQIGLFGTGLTTLLCPLAKDYLSLMITFIVFGLVDGVSAASYNILVLGCARKGRYGQAIGFSSAVQSMGLISGPPLGGLIMEQLGAYEVAFYLAGGVIMLAFVLLFLIPCLENQDPKLRQTNQDLLDESLMVLERETVL